MSRSHPDNSIQKRQRRARLLHSIYSWHRWMGLSILLWVLMWAVSGLLIEASPTLGLDRKTVKASWLMKHYGLPQAKASGRWDLEVAVLEEWDQGISYNGQWLQQSQSPIKAAAYAAGFIVVADQQSLQLYSLDGSWVDQLPTPSPIQQLGNSDDNRVIAATSKGLYEMADDWLSWQKSQRAAPQWNLRQPANKDSIAPPSLHDISYERVLLDIHSGTFFGPVGRWLTRLAAVVMLLLAVSGFYTWFTRFAKRR